MTKDMAVEKARKCLQKHASEGEEAYIYMWTDDDQDRDWSRHIGVRVAEAGFTTESGGCSYMQSDVGGLAVIAAIERLILEYIYEDDNEILLQEEILNMAIRGES